MKTIIKTLVLSLALFSMALVNSNAQELKVQKTRYSIEIDPATFAFNGYSAHLRIQPKTHTHLLFGLGIYAMDMPDVLVNFNEKNRDLGWNVRLNMGLGIFGEHHFTEVNKKWFVGGQVSLQEYKIDVKESPGNEKFTNLLMMVYGGYTIQPFDFNLYFKPWAGIGYTSKISGETQLDSGEYDVAPVTMFATLHIGYSF